MQSLYIPHLLQRTERTQNILIDDFIPGLDTLMPFRGTLSIRHGGTFLDIKVKGETIVTLICDRCLQQYNHRIIVDTSEIVWLDKNLSLSDIPQEREVSLEDLSETLSPDGHFNSETWLYEQLSLAMPFRRLCGKNCQQPVVSDCVENLSPIDNRWASLECLKQKFSQ
ncbi:MAG: YceD family protein [cyanobacterium endosymbiont of Rhopalodia musculus]|uniref:YceD family protein n=1 Tax=cyanobacterium endosymbiont of Epithemia clementina EcSB TaxID=3034674 RepID=UPI002480AC41|nr:YceD family protein [cyanobacterium endosymbiont of Epithemia clementina EcSB]WGT67411.1 YceD family protein [cyanobacterium endosymbiont of Epithemia clementina EcSB]